MDVLVVDSSGSKYVQKINDNLTWNLGNNMFKDVSVISINPC